MKIFWKYAFKWSWNLEIWKNKFLLLVSTVLYNVAGYGGELGDSLGHRGGPHQGGRGVVLHKGGQNANSLH